MTFASAAAVPPRSGAGAWYELIRLVSDALSMERRNGVVVAPSISPVRPDLDLAPPSGGSHFDTQTLGETGLELGEDNPDAELGDELLPGPDDEGDLTDGRIDADHAEVWALVHRAQTGDGDAFGLLYDRYVDSVYRFIYYRVNDRALAEDFTSETFLRALRRITSINYQGRDIGAWFMTIARNIVFDHSKSARFRLEMSTGEDIESDERAPSPELMVLANLTNERLLQAVNDLNDEQKECVALRFLHGMSVAETAEVMGKNEGAIKALQHRAVKRLAVLIGDDLR